MFFKYIPMQVNFNNLAIRFNHKNISSDLEKKAWKKMVGCL